MNAWQTNPIGRLRGGYVSRELRGDFSPPPRLVDGSREMPICLAWLIKRVLCKLSNLKVRIQEKNITTFWLCGGDLIAGSTISSVIFEVNNSGCEQYQELLTVSKSVLDHRRFSFYRQFESARGAWEPGRHSIVFAVSKSPSVFFYTRAPSTILPRRRFLGVRHAFLPHEDDCVTSRKNVCAAGEASPEGLCYTKMYSPLTAGNQLIARQCKILTKRHLTSYS